MHLEGEGVFPRGPGHVSLPYLVSEGPPRLSLLPGIVWGGGCGMQGPERSRACPFPHVHIHVACLHVLCRGLPTYKCKPRMNFQGVFFVSIYMDAICLDMCVSVCMHMCDSDDVFSYLYKCVGMDRHPKYIEYKCECVCMCIYMSRWTFMNLNMLVNIYNCEFVYVYRCDYTSICEHMHPFSMWEHVYAKCVNVCVHWVYKFVLTCAQTCMGVYLCFPMNIYMPMYESEYMCKYTFIQNVH